MSEPLALPYGSSYSSLSTCCIPPDAEVATVYVSPKFMIFHTLHKGVLIQNQAQHSGVVTPASVSHVCEGTDWGILAGMHNF